MQLMLELQTLKKSSVSMADNLKKKKEISETLSIVGHVVIER